MTSRFVQMFGFFFVLGLLGCQGSPLFSHAAAPDEHQAVETSPDSQTCPLHFEKENLCAELAWVSQPSDEEGGVMTLRFWSATDGSKDGPYIAPAVQPHVYLWMPHHGHGSSPIQTQSLTDAQGSALEGEYKLSGIYFVMPGGWEFHVQLKSNGSVLDEAIMPYVAQ